MNTIYLDNNATTQLDERVLQHMIPLLTSNYGNAASHTHSFGWAAQAHLEKALETIASVLNCNTNNLFFTQSATQGIHTLFDLLLQNYNGNKKQIIVNCTEHSALHAILKKYESKFEICNLPVSRNGIVDLDILLQLLKKPTLISIVMHANNETGSIQDTDTIAKLCKENDSLLFCDCTQSIGKCTFSINIENIDFMVFSAHKFHGPKGVGLLYINSNFNTTFLKEKIIGNSLPHFFYSGTVAVHQAVGLAYAMKYAVDEYWNTNTSISANRTKIEQSMQFYFDAHINGDIKNRLSNTTNIYIHKLKAQQLISACPTLAFSLGSACTQGKNSYVLAHMGLNEEEIKGSFRISLSKFTTNLEVDQAIELLVNTTKKLIS
jgi:cysteine desulfurase